MLLSTLSQQQKNTFLNLAHSVAVSDGEFSTSEELMILGMCREMDLDNALEAHYIDITGIEAIYPTRRSRIIVIIALIRLGYADGAFEVEEKSFISDLCNLFDVSNKDFGLLENWVRRLISLELEAQDYM